MSSYTVNLKSDRHAINETIDYLGAEHFNGVVNSLRKYNHARLSEKMRHIHFVFGMLGVRGYALHHALFRHVYL